MIGLLVTYAIEKILLVFLDQVSIGDGEVWQNCFEQGVANSSVIIVLISDKALSSMKNLTPEKDDNLLHEWDMALDYYEKGTKFIYILLVAQEEGNNEIKFSSFDTSVFPNCKCKSTKKTVREIITKLLQIQGFHVAPSHNLDLLQKKLFVRLSLFEQT